MIDVSTEVAPSPADDGDVCAGCGAPCERREGRYGPYTLCMGCGATERLLAYLDASCPKCGEGLVWRHTRRRRRFIGCASYPACDYTRWGRE